MVDGHLNFDVKTDTAGFDKGTQAITKSFGGMKKVLIGISATLAGLFSAKEMIEYAAEVKALNAQYEQTFGTMQEAAGKAINAIADSSGIINTRLKGTATQIYAFAKTAGMDGTQALDLMSDALQVTADSAAYYDRSLEDTAATLQSFLKGNYANDAALGLSATETTRNAAAMELYGKKFQDLSEAQKQFTLLQMVKDANRLSGAMGQAARESEGWENVLGNLKEAWKQMLAAVGQPLLALAIPIVKRLTGVLQTLTKFATQAANALAKVFGLDLGTGADNSAQIADNAEQAAESYEDMAEAAEEAQEANENSLASFDQINKLDDDKDSSKTASSGGADNVGSALMNGGSVKLDLKTNIDDVNKDFTDFFESAKRNFGALLDPFKKAWDSKGSGVLSSMNGSLSAIKRLVSDIGNSFLTVWTNGTGQTTLEHILGIWENINNFVGNIATALDEAWTEDGLGTSVIQHAADILNTILDYSNKITKSWAKWAEKIDFKPLLESLDKLEIALQPFTENIGEGLLWFNENVLQPLASWTIEDLIPAFLEALADAIEGASAAWKTAAPVLEERLWKKFLQPLAKWAGQKAIDLIKKLGEGIKDLGNSITEEDVNALIDLAEGIAAIVAACKGFEFVISFAAAIKGLGGKISGAFALAKVPIGASAGEAGAAAGVSLSTALLTAVISAIAGWTIGSMIYDKFSDEIDETVEFMADSFVDFWGGVYDTCAGFLDDILFGWKNLGKDINKEWTDATTQIKNNWRDFKKSWNEGWNTVKNKASSAWKDIKDNFSTAYDRITEIFKDIGTWFENRWTDIKAPFANVGSFFREKFDKAWKNIKEAFSSPDEFFNTVWRKIKSAFSKTVSWFKEKFENAWDTIKKAFELDTVGEFFGDVVEKIADAFSGLADLIKAPINAVIDVVNGAIDNINGISIDVPDWATDVIGSETIGFDIPKIPKLAQGTYIPKNYGEFLAVLGDNKREAEVVSPVSAMKQALLEALVEYGSVGGGDKQPLVVQLLLDRREIGRASIDDINERTRRNGKSPLVAT